MLTDFETLGILLPPPAQGPLVPRTRNSHDFAAGTVANFGFKSGTRIIMLLVSFRSRSSLRGCGKCCELRDRDTSDKQLTWSSREALLRQRWEYGVSAGGLRAGRAGGVAASIRGSLAGSQPTAVAPSHVCHRNTGIAGYFRPCRIGTFANQEPIPNHVQDNRNQEQQKTRSPKCPYPAKRSLCSLTAPISTPLPNRSASISTTSACCANSSRAATCCGRSIIPPWSRTRSIRRFGR